MGFIYCNLRVLMAKNELNIQKVKEKTTLSRTTISNLYNNNGAGVQYETMSELCDLFSCQPGDLFEYVDAEVEFQELDRKTTTSVSVEKVDEEPISYKANAHIAIASKVIYNKELFSLDFNVNSVNLGLDKDKNVAHLTWGLNDSKHFDLYHEDYGIPKIVEKYFLNKLNDFIVNWAFDYFKTYKND